MEEDQQIRHDTEADDHAGPQDTAKARVGRKRDPTRDVVILDAALEVLAEVGFARMTIDEVAARAKAGKATVYRRWASKAEMVVDAVTRMKRTMVDLDHLPDTGTLRGDLVALIRPQSADEEERKLRVMGGLVSMMTHDSALADAVNAAVSEPWTDAYRVLMRRAIARGEIAEPADIEMLVQVIPSLAAHRVLVQRRSVDSAFLVPLIDGLLLPALGLPRADHSDIGHHAST